MKLMSASCSLLLAAAPASAHHAFAVEFDAKNCADVTGVLTKVDYENPHAYIFVDVKDAAGRPCRRRSSCRRRRTCKRGGATLPVLNASLNKEVLVRGCASQERRGQPLRGVVHQAGRRHRAAPGAGRRRHLRHQDLEITMKMHIGVMLAAALRCCRWRPAAQEQKRLRRSAGQRQAGAAAAGRPDAAHGGRQAGPLGRLVPGPDRARRTPGASCPTSASEEDPIPFQPWAEAKSKAMTPGRSSS